MPDFAQRPYHIGRTNITVYKYGNHELTDSLTLRNITMRWSGGKAKRPPLRLRALIRYLHMRKGSLYSEEAHTTMQDQIAAMGIFSTLQLDFVPRHDTDTAEGTKRLSWRAMARMRAWREISFVPINSINGVGK